MPVIDYIDGPNRRIYLHADTADAEVHPIDIYKEMRTLRRTIEDLRKFDKFLEAKGYDTKSAGKFTERYVICLDGTRIVPYDADHTITITGTIITDDGKEGVDCFDRALLTPTTVVDINYVPPQVEVIVIGGNTEDAVWDAVLTGSSHNNPQSAGRKLRTIAAAVITEGTSPDGSNTINSIVLDVNASAIDGEYDPSVVSIINGTGAGQCRLILQYDGTSKRAWIDRDWKTIPDDTSEYVITAHPGREHVNEGVLQGGTLTTVTLNALASDFDEAYTGQTIFLRSGLGQDQACKVVGYNGTTKVASLCKDLSAIPNDNTCYVILPAGYLNVAQMTKKMLELGVASEATALLSAVATEFLEKIVINKKEMKKNGTAWELIVYDDDDLTPILNKVLTDKDAAAITDLQSGALAQEAASNV